ncbi:GNAT family N-acetyltransferase [Alicyclobacillus fodiniaquatilis]|uniref:GNAT family N-acetyltransferase n=1 Tax=Alicyclobacillus fodiniaquatilis TaxID=1661150 RepID=A0ABW4JKV7_9BACL
MSADFMPVIETNRTILRQLVPADAGELFAYASDEAVAKYTTWQPHQTVDDARQFIQRALERYAQNIHADWGIIEKATDRLIGTCGFVHVHPHRRAEIGYALGRTHWNQGLMSEVVKSVILYGFKTLQLHRIEARADVRNVGSWRVMEKCNMTFEGVLRGHLFAKNEFHDVRMYSILVSELDDP